MEWKWQYLVESQRFWFCVLCVNQGWGNEVWGVRVGSLVAAGNEEHLSCDLLALSVFVWQGGSRAESSSWAISVWHCWCYKLHFLPRFPSPALLTAAQLCIISRICQQSSAFVLRLWRNIVTKIALQSSFRGALLVDCLLVNNSLFSFLCYSLPFSTFLCITFWT